MNLVVLIGRLGRDPEVRVLDNGTPVCQFSLATSRVWNDAKGERVERTQWHRIVAWGKRAEICANNLTKGREVAIVGHIQSRDWTDAEGTRRTVFEVVVDNIKFVGSKQDGQRRTATAAAAAAAGEALAEGITGSMTEEDLPPDLEQETHEQNVG